MTSAIPVQRSPTELTTQQGAYIHSHLFITLEFNTNPKNDQLPVGLLASSDGNLCTGIAKLMGSTLARVSIQAFFHCWCS